MTEDALVKLVKDQIKIERSFVASVDKQIKGIHNVAAKLLLLETKKDSEKHALILEGILEVVSQKDAKPLWDTLQDSYVDKLVVKKNLENHMLVEKEMLKHVEDEIRETRDDGIKLLLEHIASDEKNHHKILQTVIEQAYKIKP